jgi:hypothetical protein
MPKKYERYYAMHCCNRYTKNDYVKGESCVNCVDFWFW